jgi:hypothetical protein
MQLARLQTRRVVSRQTGGHGAVQKRHRPAWSPNGHLHAVVIRLPAIALWRVHSRATEFPNNDWLLPVGYRSWPPLVP